MLLSDDHSRVKLNADVEDSETAEDYINASFVEVMLAIV